MVVCCFAFISASAYSAYTTWLKLNEEFSPLLKNKNMRSDFSSYRAMFGIGSKYWIYISYQTNTVFIRDKQTQGKRGRERNYWRERKKHEHEVTHSPNKKPNSFFSVLFISFNFVPFVGCFSTSSSIRWERIYRRLNFISVMQKKNKPTKKNESTFCINFNRVDKKNILK